MEKSRGKIKERERRWTLNFWREKTDTKVATTPSRNKPKPDEQSSDMRPWTQAVKTLKIQWCQQEVVPGTVKAILFQKKKKEEVMMS